MALNNAVFQLIHGRFANVLFANVLSHFTYVLGRFSYSFRLIMPYRISVGLEVLIEGIIGQREYE